MYNYEGIDDLYNNPRNLRLLSSRKRSKTTHRPKIKNERKKRRHSAKKTSLKITHTQAQRPHVQDLRYREKKLSCSEPI